MSNKPEKKQTGKVNYVWVLAGGYLIYLAYKILRTFLAGEADEPLLAIGFVILFVVVGGLVLLREWKAYKFGMEHIDDPETWSDDEEEDEELAQLMESSKSAAAKVLETENEEDVEETAEDEA